MLTPPLAQGAPRRAQARNNDLKDGPFRPDAGGAGLGAPRIPLSGDMTRQAFLAESSMSRTVLEMS